MRKILAIFVFFVACSCNDAAVEKPAKLIDEAQMADIIYDLAILEAMRSKDPAHNNTNPNAYILKKYHVDSLQFAQNNRYYASDIATYKKIYENVEQRIKNERSGLDSIAGKSGDAPVPAANSDAPQVQ